MSKTFAAMSGNLVSNILVADNLQDAELASGLPCSEYTDENPAGIGWAYDSETQLFSAPATDEVAAEEPSV